MNILMVCLGNICRSPIAHGIMESKVKHQGLNWLIDSAGTGNWHAGEKPDARAIAEAKKNGVDITYQRARQITLNDFNIFDLILVMDTDNYNQVRSLAPNAAAKSKVHMILNFLEEDRNMPVPDPYYDGRFALVFDLLDKATDCVIEKYGETALV